MLLRNPLALVILAALFVPVERIFWLRRQRLLRPGWRTDLIHFFVTHTLLQLCLVLSVGLVVAAVDPLVSPRLQDAVAGQPRALQVVEALLLVEFLGYGCHRAFHRVPWLWRIHAVHHSSEQLDWLAALRVHPFDQAITRTVQFVPLYLLGFPLEIFAGAAGLVGLWAVFLHANVRFRFGPFERLLATPAFHHWHHSAEAAGRDTNFSGLFPWVDALFGTLHLPREWPRTYGTDLPVPQGYLEQLAFPLTRGPTPPPAAASAPPAPAR
ncbi:MAG: sterol desaturase family protein [Myxococcota bacterium]